MLKTFFSEGIVEAGCDEAGRGCLAGPVFAAAVILSQKNSNNSFAELAALDDSKKLKPVLRYNLRILIEKIAIDFAVATVDPEEIDKINILNASFLAMHRALDKLKVRPEGLIIDGNRFRPYQDVPHQCIVGGDGKYLSIAAASVLAKTYRDEYMESIHNDYPCYGWKNNKGYPTRTHRKAIALHGISPHHRKSYRLIDHQLRLPFN